MTVQNAKNFMAKVMGDEVLTNRLSGLGSAEDIAALAREMGFEVSSEDIASAMDAPTELTDDDLANVVGGNQTTGSTEIPAKTTYSDDTRCHTDKTSAAKGCDNPTPSSDDKKTLDLGPIRRF
jgi:predicted ribosomally synthesized peptide with nif11-like leader